MEASTLQAPTTLAKPRVSAPTPFLRLRSDEQLVALFRAGHDDAFRAIHDRYNKRLLAYARQMLPGRQDAEDALQDVFVRAYSGLRANDRDLALRAWLFRVAHNRCVDELRRPAPPPPEVLHLVRSTVQDPVAEVDLRESLRRLIADVRRLPDQQRSALLLRELGGLSYAELATSLGISVGAVKSVLVRARIALAQAAEARDTACSEIREELVGSCDRGVRPNANARRHMRDCAGCRDFRRELRGVNRQLAALAPAVGPLGFLAQLLGFSGGAGGGATAGGATAGGATAGGATVGGAAIASGGGATASAGAALGAGHVATLIAAAVATAGGAVAIQHTIAPAHRHHARAHVAGTRGAHHAVPARQIGSPADAAADGYAPSAAAAASAGAAAQKARAAVLAHHKHGLRQAALSGTGGGALIGSMGKDGSGKTAAGVATGTAVTGAAKKKGSSAAASATGNAGGSCSAATGVASSTGTGAGTGTASQASTGTATGTAATSTGTAGSGTAASTPNATATASETATGANSTPCSTTGNGSQSTSTGSGTGTPATGSGSSGSSSASTSSASAAGSSASSGTPAWY